MATTCGGGLLLPAGDFCSRSWARVPVVPGRPRRHASPAPGRAGAARRRQRPRC